MKSRLVSVYGYAKQVIGTISITSHPMGVRRTIVVALALLHVYWFQMNKLYLGLLQNWAYITPS